VADLTEEIRRDFSQRYSSVSGYGGWPHVNPEPFDLPATLPSHRDWPKISIVTPSFNQGRYIEETILSVLNQGYPNFEHIIVDGGSTDETLEIHVISEPDNGQSHAINKGMALATGQILTWLNSDDRLAPGALASIAMAFESSDVDMVAGICRLYRDGECVHQHLTACVDGPLPLENLLDLDGGWNAGQFFYQPEVMFTRELWLRAGGYVNDWLHYSMDYELWLRFAEAGAKLHVIGRPVAWFRLHEDPCDGTLPGGTDRGSGWIPEDARARERGKREERAFAIQPANYLSQRPRPFLRSRDRARPVGASGGAGRPCGHAGLNCGQAEIRSGGARLHRGKCDGSDLGDTPGPGSGGQSA
jgi:hypothetical protein